MRGASSRERAARRVALSILKRLRAGQLTVVEGASVLALGSGSPRAVLHVRSPRLWPKLLSGSRGMAEAYMQGLWDSPDLVELVRVGARNVGTLDAWRRRLAPARAGVQALRGVRARNTRARSRHDIADETMSYSCAYFPRAGMSLEEASTAKLELICDALELEPQDEVLEIGSGWGGLAIHAARTRGCRVTTTTISREQYERIHTRAREAGVADRVRVLCEDYRDLRGRYSKLASIEMIEAVGWRDFGTFFGRCSSLLSEKGRMLLQAIVIDDRAYGVEKASRSFMRTHIFPNGCLPSLEVIARCLARRTDMRALALTDLTPHYPQTLRRWRSNFEFASGRLSELGYDEPFRRLWRMYLAYCEAGFVERRIGVVQLTLDKPHRRESSRSRAAATALALAA